MDTTDPITYIGRVKKVQGLLIESSGPQAVLGELCRISLPDGRTAWAEVVGLDKDTVKLMPYSDTEGIELGAPVVAHGSALSVQVSDRMLGRVLDAMGKPMDGKGELSSSVRYPVIANPPPALDRTPITRQISTGVRVIDALTPIGMGQRLGIFSGSGVGKSTLLGMIARNTNADINVIALIGERGREVREFIENDLGPEGLARSVLIVATSDMPPLARLKAAYVATAVAEYFRDQGKNVMLMFDSVTRFAKAQREIGLSTGEAPATRGYPASVFALLPRLLERAGTGEKGSITGFYTILVDGDDMDEPIADTVRGILDGHLVLSRKLAERAHYPAVDSLASISRLASKVSTRDMRDVTNRIRRLMATYKESEDLITVGAYAKGTHADIDLAIAKHPVIQEFLRQDVEERSTLDKTWARAAAIVDGDLPPEQLEALAQSDPERVPPSPPEGAVAANVLERSIKSSLES